ncbi:MAG TPA: ribosome maturation factor RimM [Bryobacteraceae bacterium]|nr:ribosome maturation factor RimM [Bryobacteraceae bacterium]
MDESWHAIGRLWRARGNRGELLGELDSSDPEREQKLREVALEVNGRRQVMRVEKTWRHDGRPVFKFAGIDSISDAEKWEGAEMLVRASEVEPPAEGAFSYADLVGCRVFGESEVGVVTEVEEYGGAPLLKVEAADGHEILIPFARSICKVIDVASKSIRVELPEGLLEQQ